MLLLRSGPLPLLSGWGLLRAGVGIVSRVASLEAYAPSERWCLRPGRRSSDSLQWSLWSGASRWSLVPLALVHLLLLLALSVLLLRRALLVLLEAVTGVTCTNTGGGEFTDPDLSKA